MNEIYLVTGAAGFLGSNICRELIENGKKVRAFVLPNDKSAKYLPQGVEQLEGDLCNIDDVNKFFDVEDGYESICLHIASIVTVNPDYNQKVIDVNVGGTKNIIEAMKNHPECKKLVYCSSTGAIPEEPKPNKIKETYDFDENKVVGCYSMSKAMATKLVLDEAAKGLNACVVHPSGILGPQDYAIGETTGVVIQIIKGEMPMGIAGSFNLCDVRDLAHGVILAADKGKKGECYILGNDEVTFKSFSKILSEEAQCKKVKMFLPIGFANFIAKRMENKAKKKGTRPLMTTFSVYNLARNNNFDSLKAKKELGYTTRPYNETIRDEVKWLRQEGLI
ncbi:MAG: NAD-dependent epimerase/dehydratase family protein [Acholeplasmatales bacterium]|nr:NAD-dependent epimerase/dehydratase family protein [Acholeplasmatales bacterium]